MNPEYIFAQQVYGLGRENDVQWMLLLDIRSTIRRHSYDDIAQGSHFTTAPSTQPNGDQSFCLCYLNRTNHIL